jgi:hypothetical protein
MHYTSPTWKIYEFGISGWENGAQIQRHGGVWEEGLLGKLLQTFDG